MRIVLVLFVVGTSTVASIDQESEEHGSNGILVGNTGYILNFTLPTHNMLVMDGVTDIGVSCSVQMETQIYSKLFLQVEIYHEDIVMVLGKPTFLIDCNDNNKTDTKISLKGLFLGHTWLTIWYKAVKDEIVGTIHHDINMDIYSENTTKAIWIKLEHVLPIAVKRKGRLVDKIFMGVIVAMVTIVQFLMGCKLDLEVVKEVMKKPVAPAIGFASQFIIMPLVSTSKSFK